MPSGTTSGGLSHLKNVIEVLLKSLLLRKVCTNTFYQSAGATSFTPPTSLRIGKHVLTCDKIIDTNSLLWSYCIKNCDFWFSFILFLSHLIIRDKDSIVVQCVCVLVSYKCFGLLSGKNPPLSLPLYITCMYSVCLSEGFLLVQKLLLGS